MADAREVPILMSGSMVRAILRGEKTVTRRLVKPAQPPDTFAWVGSGPMVAPGWLAFEWLNGRTKAGTFIRPRPSCAPGDALYVKEALRAAQGRDATLYGADGADVLPCAECGFVNCAKRSVVSNRPWRWKPKALGAMYMPRWAARTFLDVVSVRAERLGDMTDAEAVAEGFGYASIPDGASECWPAAGEMVREKVKSKRVRAAALAALVRAEAPLAAFRIAWEALGHTWDPQAWVWRIEFRRRTT